MPKAEKGSVKDIANGMKARGLQKLKFYCQMCQKQCRDANGFKCHVQSESHMRQMKIFGDDASGFLKQYSENFEKSFLTTLRMRHGTKKVNANNIYQEVIADKQHIHMNATHWTTLSDFVQYLGPRNASLKKTIPMGREDGRSPISSATPGYWRGGKPSRGGRPPTKRPKKPS
jgi:DNA/RNA-binding protein KIN17